MKRFASLVLFPLILFGISSVASASTIKVSFTANGQQETVPVEQGDIVHVSWTSEASEPVIGCKGSGVYGVLTMNGAEWAGSSLPSSGSADLKVVDWHMTGAGFAVYCWLEGWPQNAQFGSNIAQDEILFLDKRVGAKPKGSVPIIATLIPSSGPVGTRVEVVGSGFTDNNDVGFIGSTHQASGSHISTVSPIDGETHFAGVSSVNGKTLTFTIPAMMAASSNEKNEMTSQPIVVPGIYYVLVQTDSGKSGVSYFKVTNSGEKSDFVQPTTSYVINSNLGPRDLGPEVVKLQTLLAKDRELYPEGIVTGHFGSLTQKAVQRFQCKYEIVCSGSPETSGFGSVDLKTRLKIEEVFGGKRETEEAKSEMTHKARSTATTTINTILVTTNQSKQESVGTFSAIFKQIQRLQQFLQWH